MQKSIKRYTSITTEDGVSYKATDYGLYNGKIDAQKVFDLLGNFHTERRDELEFIMMTIWQKGYEAGRKDADDIAEMENRQK